MITNNKHDNNMINNVNIITIQYYYECYYYYTNNHMVNTINIIIY